MRGLWFYEKLPIWSRSEEKKITCLHNIRTLFLKPEDTEETNYSWRTEWEGGRWIESRITKATDECWTGPNELPVATGCHVERSHWESIGDQKTEWEEETSTYCPQRKPEEGHKQRRSVPAWYAMHQEAALIWNHTHRRLLEQRQHRQNTPLCIISELWTLSFFINTSGEGHM